MTIIAGCVLPSFGTKALQFNGVSPKTLWPIPYCSTTAVAHPFLAGAAFRVGNKISVITIAIVTKAIRLRRANVPSIDFMFKFTVVVEFNVVHGCKA